MTASTSRARARSRRSSASTSARSRPSSTRTCGRRAVAYLHGVDRLADEVLVMTSAGGLVPAAEAAELPAALLLSGPGGRRPSRRGWPRPRPGSPTPSPSTWAARAPTCASCSTACPSPAPGRVAAASRCGCRRSTSTPSAPGGGSIARIDAGGALVVGPEQRGSRRPARPATAAVGRADRDRRRPRRSAASLPTRRSPASAGSTATRPRAPSTEPA